MQFAIVDGQRRGAEPKRAGTCPICGKPMLPKCGSKILWHWAHHRRKHCDPWWENETDWHRWWKSCFPEAWREQIHFDEKGEKHVADVKTPAGTVLEFQNSAMSPQELQARERFYGRMLWIVNGTPFMNQFHILGRLPAQEAYWTQDLVFFPQKRDWRGRGFWRKSENPGHEPGGMVLIHDVSEIQDQIDKDYVGHHLYDWDRPRTVWFESRSPVFVDFGGDLLWNTQQYGHGGLQCVRAVRKATLISSHGGKYSETGEVVRAAKRARRNGDPVDRGEDGIILGRVR
jgi:competence protein CoiA